MVITKASYADLPAVGELYGCVCDGLQGKPYNPGWQRDGFPTQENAEIFLKTGTLLLSWEGGALAGSVGFTNDPSAEDDEGGENGPFPGAPQREDGIWYIHVLAVHPDFQRRGIGSRLLAAARDEVRRMGGPLAAAVRLGGKYPRCTGLRESGILPRTGRRGYRPE